jgi:hypothetical protein
MIQPKILHISFNRPSEPLRVYLRDDNDRVVATFEDFGEAHRWLKEHNYEHNSVNGGLWVLP